MYPRVIAEITDKFDLAELELTVTRMGEDGFQWNRKMSAPPGAFIAATFGESNRYSVEERWSSLVGVLAGLFCVSLNQLNLETSISPRWPIPGMAPVGENLSHRRLGFLPREVSCTENLTPWKKILPAGKGFGLVHYLSNAHHQLRHSSYWSLSLHFQREDSNYLALKHTAVVDVRQVTNGELQLVDQMLKGAGDSRTAPIPISAQVLFGVSGYKKTPLARSSTLTLSRHLATNVKISQTTFEKIKMTPQVTQSNLTETWKMELSDDFSIRMAWNYAAPAKGRENFIKVSRFNGGSGQGQGKIISRIENNFGEAKNVVTMEVIPWWIIPKVSKMKIKNCELKQKLYTPAQDNERKTASLLMNLKLAPDSECIVEFEYSTAWPKWTEYPPDANHGRYLPSVMAFYEDLDEIRRTFSGYFVTFCMNNLKNPVCQLNVNLQVGGRNYTCGQVETARTRDWVYFRTGHYPPSPVLNFKHCIQVPC